MKLIAIAAVALDGTIGIGNEIPWKIPEDFKHFRNTTIGHTLLVGYNTYLSLPEKAFEDRRYIVLNSYSERGWDVLREGVIQYNNLNSLLHHLEYLKDVETVFLAGGAMIYDTLINRCDEAIITWVNKTFEKGDKKFPIDKLFTNFEVINDSAWIRSKSETLYKITTYKKI